MYLANINSWYLERVLFLIAGLMIIISTVLAIFVHTTWLLLAVFVGLNLVIFAVTGFCFIANILVILGLKSAIETDD